MQQSRNINFIMIRRNTKSKQMVLDLLTTSNFALCHEEILQELESKIDRATVYRILNSFCEDGIVHKIVGDEGKQYFALCKKCTAEKHLHQHLHFKCKLCQKVKCIDYEVKINLPEGYTMENFNAFISGYCPACSEKIATQA